MKLKYSKYLLIAILTAVFILPSGIIYAQNIPIDTLQDVPNTLKSVGDVLNPFPAGPSACGVSGEGLCQSSCGPYDIANIDSKYCSDEEQCCIKTICRNNESGLGDCRTASNCGELTSKETSDCNSKSTPAKLCCISPKIPEVTCPGGICYEDSTGGTLIPQEPKGEDSTGGTLIPQEPKGEDSTGGTLIPQEPKGLVPCTGLDCTLCSLFELIKNIIDWLVGFTIAVSVAFIVWAGIQMMFSGGDPGRVTDARKTATTAVLGVALALGGWLIIGTLLGALTGSDKIMPWNKITCSAKPMGIGTEVATQSAACATAGGTCQNTIVLCGGEWKSGLCGGTDNIKCCVFQRRLK